MSAASPDTVSQCPRAIRWVFLDRDGTLNVKPREGEYVERPEEIELLPGAAEGVRMLNRAGFWTGVVTNQRGVALGRMSAADVDAVHERLERLLGREGASLDAIYTCPHESGDCRCRKPHPGMLLRAREENPALDFQKAAIVGDSSTDLQAGRHVGAETVLISAPGDPEDRSARALADHIVPSLLDAARLLIARPPHAEPHAVADSGVR
jgi:D-glycero-D-manno-heptose 1,7-bisphosphate phosphatase